MNLKGGTTVGRYRIVEYINEGGMQQVYRATDLKLGREVAFKVPKNDAGDRRFDQSARVSARVSNANVARTLDYFEHEGRRYLVEEFVDGFDLGVLLKRVPQLDPYIVARILHGIARGIAAVHSQDVVHRDLKPSNIMVDGGFLFQDVKVTDFGVARMAEAEIEAGVAGGAIALTGSKTLIGHLPYLAPEVLRRRKTVSPAADIWAVGALAFHLLAGAPPFGYELAEAVLQILTAPVPPLPREVESSPQYSDVGREIYGIIIGCLQRDPASRPTAAQLVQLCERLCYPDQPRETATVTGYPGGSFGFADSKRGPVFFHVASAFPSRPAVGAEIWFSRHPGQPNDRAHPVIPIVAETPQ